MTLNIPKDVAGRYPNSARLLVDISLNLAAGLVDMHQRADKAAPMEEWDAINDTSLVESLREEVQRSIDSFCHISFGRGLG